MTYKYNQIDNWYFGDYTGGVAGKSYNFLVYAAIILSCLQLQYLRLPAFCFQGIYVPYSYNLIEIFYVDMIGKISSWAKVIIRWQSYFLVLWSTTTLDLPLVFLVTNYFDNESLPLFRFILLKFLP